MDKIKNRTWWGREYQKVRNDWQDFMQNVDNIHYESKKSFDWGPPKFTLTIKGKLVHYTLERADVDEHPEEIEEAIWGLKEDTK